MLGGGSLRNGFRLVRKIDRWTSARCYTKVTRAQTIEELNELRTFYDEEKNSKCKKKPSRKPRAEVFTWGYSGTGALADERFFKSGAEQQLPHRIKNRRTPARVRSIGLDMNVYDVAAGYGFTIVAATVANEPYFLFGCGLNTDSQIGYQATEGGKPLVCVTNLVPIRIPLDLNCNNDKKERIVKVAAGRAHTLALTSVGGVYSLGNNTFGQCGRPIVDNEKYFGSRHVHQLRFKLATDDRVVKVVCGADHSLFLTAHGRVLACGWAVDGQLGNGSQQSTGTVSEVGGDLRGENIVSISSAADCCLALSARGELFGWGNSEYGQLGTSESQVTVARHLTAIEKTIEHGDRIVDVAAGGSMATLLTKTGRVFTWGYGLLGLGPNVREATLPRQIHPGLFAQRPVRRLTAGVDRMAAINDRGQLFMWGANGKAQLGVAGQIDLSYPMAVLVSSRVEKVSLGMDHTVALGRQVT